jgi:hypothetical protein
MSANKELSILKWVGVVLACLSTLFTLAIVGSHLSGRLAGLGRVGIVGTVGAELMAISCAWLVASDRKRVAGVAMVCQLILTAVLLVNASIALDLDWQETLAGKAAERQLTVEKQAAEERRKTLEKQAELALQLVEKDRRLARAFVRAERPSGIEAAEARETAGANPLLLDLRRMSVYERYGLTVMPLFLALLTVIALAAAAQSGNAGPKSMEPSEMPDLTASVVADASSAPFDAGTLSRKAKKEIAGTVSAFLLPTGADKKKSVTIGRYQFCKDGAGWRCSEIVGGGSLRKRSYLAYLSRASYLRMQLAAATREELEEKLIEWADKKRSEKPQRSLPFQPEADTNPETAQKKLAIPRISR